MRVSLSLVDLGWFLKRAMESKQHKQSDIDLLVKDMLLDI